MLVFTTKGELPIESLAVTDLVEYHDNARVVATEWRLDGEIVRRDVTVSVLHGMSLNSEKGEI